MTSTNKGLTEVDKFHYLLHSGLGRYFISLRSGTIGGISIYPDEFCSMKD
ncbi:hypothetical protein DSBG_0750 [Desulfosporosinus sp. BG]|nr:hypothetical protein DSBG_0750 [Desulfosporosinus sp. BG]